MLGLHVPIFADINGYYVLSGLFSLLLKKNQNTSDIFYHLISLLEAQTVIN